MDSTTSLATVAPRNYEGGMVKIHNTYNDEVINVPRYIIEMFEVWSLQLQRWTDGCPLITYWGDPKVLKSLIGLATYRTYCSKSYNEAMLIEANRLGLRCETRLLIAYKSSSKYQFMDLYGDTYKISMMRGELTIYSEKIFRLASSDSDLTSEDDKRLNSLNHCLIISPARKIASLTPEKSDEYPYVKVSVTFDADEKPVVTLEYTKDNGNTY